MSARRGASLRTAIFVFVATVAVGALGVRSAAGDVLAQYAAGDSRHILCIGAALMVATGQSGGISEDRLGCPTVATALVVTHG